MSDPAMPRPRAKRFSSAEQNYEIWSRILAGELLTQQAAVEAGVDRSTIRLLPKTAKVGHRRAGCVGARASPRRSSPSRHS